MHDRRRFLGRLFGPQATSWRLPACSDETLVEALSSVLERKAASSVLPTDISTRLLGSDIDDQGTEDRGVEGDDRDIRWALRLAQRPIDQTLLRRIEVAEDVPELLRVRAASSARLTGNARLASRLVRGLKSDEARLEHALSAHRLGNRGEARQILESLQVSSSSAKVRSLAGAALARRLWDDGDVSSQVPTETSRIVSER
jgi:hypothetical protein